jgi:hypothetical protein
LVRLTRKGDRSYRRLNVRLLEIASTMGADLNQADIRKCFKIVRRLSDETKDPARWNQRDLSEDRAAPARSRQAQARSRQ